MLNPIEKKRFYKRFSTIEASFRMRAWILTAIQLSRREAQCVKGFDDSQGSLNLRRKRERRNPLRRRRQLAG